MNNVQELIQIENMIGWVTLLLALMLVMIGVAIFQNARQTRLLRSIDRSLKLLPGVNRELKRVA